jgi:hypothetical protein
VVFHCTTSCLTDPIKSYTLRKTEASKMSFYRKCVWLTICYIYLFLSLAASRSCGDHIIIALSDLPSIYKNQLQNRSRYSYFHEICWRVSVDPFHYLLKSNNNNGHFTWKPTRVCSDICLALYLSQRALYGKKSCTDTLMHILHPVHVLHKPYGFRNEQEILGRPNSPLSVDKTRTA